MRLRDAVGDDSKSVSYQAAAVEELGRRSQEYKRAVEATTRVAGRFGQHSKPKSAVEAQLLMIKRLDQIVEALKILADLKRVEVGEDPAVLLRPWLTLFAVGPPPLGVRG